MQFNCRYVYRNILPFFGQFFQFPNSPLSIYSFNIIAKWGAIALIIVPIILTEIPQKSVVFLISRFINTFITLLASIIQNVKSPLQAFTTISLSNDSATSGEDSTFSVESGISAKCFFQNHLLH